MTQEATKNVATIGKEAREGEVQHASPSRAMSPFEEMDRLFESFFPRSWLRPMRWEWPSVGELAAPFEGRLPKVDVVDRDSDILVRAELPGVDKKDLDISITDNTVTIHATTSREQEREEGEYYRREITRGSFARTVALPAEVDADGARASFKDGILELTVPKVAKAQRRRITVE
ncbi:MAG TPA: Hsp20/alpha crystallin family protein [Gammaproteobacteria bacterium]|nr:Hsp20/alpha crystallin family protein [Gammaproteobacteria bacterium]